MNIILWILQILLAFHTATGAIWKFSYSAAETMPALGAIPNQLWLLLAVIELIVAVALVVPVFNKKMVKFAPFAALFIVVEMVLYSVLHLASGSTEYGPILYWLVVAALAGCIAYGRLVLKPFKVSKN